MPTQVPASGIAAGAITADKIAAGAVTAAKVAEGVAGGPKITSVAVTNNSYTVLDDTAVDTAGGYIKITGTGFVTGCSVVIGTTAATSTTFVSSSEVRAQVPAQSAGSYFVYVVNPDGGTATRVNGVTYSATPTWTTASALPNATSNVAYTQALVATSATSYALQAGSSLPAGMTLSSGGTLSGTLSTDDISYSFTVLATDAELQDSPRTFSLYVNPAADPYFNSVTLLLRGNGSNGSTSFIDESTRAATITRVVSSEGISEISTDTPKYGSGFIRINGQSATGDSYGGFTVPYHSSLNFTSNSTLEFWLRPTSLSNQGMLAQLRNNFNSGGGAWDLRIGVENNDFYISMALLGTELTQGSGEYTAEFGSSTPFSLNTWTHFAIVRNSGTFTIYQNGTSVATKSLGGPGLNITQVSSVGVPIKFGFGLRNIPSWKSTVDFDDIRVTSLARYTSNFTPPTKQHPSS